MKYGCIAKALKHSFSKEIHACFDNYEYRLCELSEEDLPEFFEKRDFIGINVTIPYKSTVIKYLDEISETAKNIGAVNTIVNRDGKLYGYNTDFYGMTALIKKTGIEVKGKTVLILGSGGTSKTARAVASSLGAENIYIVSRSEYDGCIGYEKAYSLGEKVDVIINTTPVGMYPDIYKCPIEIDRFPSVSGVIDAVYNPARTMLVSSALERGIKASGGLYMLVAQAAKAYSLFFGKENFEEKIDAVYKKISMDKENIVLIGMPSSGKTTVGNMLAEKLGRKFFDSDEEFSRKFGISPAEYIRTYGEDKFRDKETKIVAKLSVYSQAVISTGGGVVERKNNIKYLSMNGKIVYLKKPLYMLTPTSDRPLSQSTAMLEELFLRRVPMYEKYADYISECDDGILESVAEIIKLVGDKNDSQN